jgi:hypothetical protein
MKKIKKFNYKNLNMIKIIFFVFVISKLLILIFFQYPSPVGDSIYFLSVSKFHCMDGIFSKTGYIRDAGGYIALML